MGKLIRSSNSKYIRYYDHWTFNHMMISGSAANQNPYDFGFLYFVQNGNNNLVGSCMYEFDMFSDVNTYLGTMAILCDDYGRHYDMDSMSYESLDIRKLIHGDDYYAIDLYAQASADKYIYNNYENWIISNSMNSIEYGGGFNLTYWPSSFNDNIYVYLTNNGLYPDYFDSYDMTDPYTLGGGTSGNSIALENNILHMYSMGNVNDYLNDDGSLTIRIAFNNIGYNQSSGEFSIFYGFNTCIYVYSSGGGFQGKTACVKKYNYNYPATSPFVQYFDFSMSKDNVNNNIGTNLIGFPIFDWTPDAYIVNYYDIEIR